MLTDYRTVAAVELANIEPETCASAAFYPCASRYILRLSPDEIIMEPSWPIGEYQNRTILCPTGIGTVTGACLDAILILVIEH